MRGLVFSDTHGVIDSCLRTVRKIKDVDMIIHAGDVSADAKQLAEIFTKIPVKYVCGNCEYVLSPSELEFSVEDKKFFVTHGHYFNVKYEDSYTTLLNKAKAVNADIVIFGHTHKPICDVREGITLLNPGSVKFGGTYGVVEIENGNLRAAVLDL